jgi:hypothetical protein
VLRSGGYRSRNARKRVSMVVHLEVLEAEVGNVVKRFGT